MKVRICCILITLITLCTSPINANTPISFKHLGMQDGLSYTQINHITKDTQGFLWFSTSYGLNRYDGYRFKVFTRNSKDKNSLPDNYVQDVQEDHQGNLWVRTLNAGYAYYQSDKEIFSEAKTILNEWFGVELEPIRLFVDSAKNLWIYDYTHGVRKFIIDSKEVVSYALPQQFGTPYEWAIVAFAENARGITLLRKNGTLVGLEKDKPSVQYVDDYLTVKIGEQQENFNLFADAYDNIWAYPYNQGAWKRNAASSQWEEFSTDADAQHRLSANMIYDIEQGENGSIWIATDHGGINIITDDKELPQVIQHEPNNERSLPHNTVQSLYCDKNGTTWVGVYRNGVSYYNSSIYKFNANDLARFSNTDDFIPDINTMTEDRQTGDIWFGSNTNGLLRLNTATKRHAIYQHQPKQNSISGNVIVSLLQGSDGKMWIGTYQNGLNMFDGKQFTHINQSPSIQSDDNIWALAEDDEGHIWIGTLGRGLHQLNRHTGACRSVAEKGSTFEKDFISSVCIGQNKDIFCSTSDGLTIYNPRTHTFERCMGNKRGNQLFTHPNLNQVYEDSRGLLWIGTQEGLNIFDRKKDEIILIEPQGILGREITYAIIEDNLKNMWITTTNSIAQVSVGTDIKTGTYSFNTTYYGEEDGLLSQGFNLRSILKTSSGEIIVGGVQGVNYFRPEKMKYNEHTPDVVFTQLSIFGQTVEIDSLYHHRRVLPQALNRSERIELEYAQNSFSIEFSSMNFILPEKITYLYTLDGFHEEWLTADQNRVSFTNLAPGYYTLKVKAINNDGFVNPNESCLDIVIRPPFWRTPWAYIAYGLALIGLLLYARASILRKERNRYKLAQIAHEAQQKHEVDDMKLRFFTNISHELRTPLTLIISPVEALLKQVSNPQQKEKLEMIHRNAIRLLTQVNQLLDFRKSDVQGHKFNPFNGDVIATLRTECNAFIAYSEKKHIHFTFYSAVPELTMIYDEDKLAKIITNLLSNAFKFTPEGGRVDVSVGKTTDEHSQPELLEIRVADSGIGIAPEDKPHVFERFYQGKQTEVHSSSGSGIGLHLVKEFVALHQGEIKVVDNIGQGTVFIVNLPIISTGKVSPSANAPLAETEEPTVATAQESDEQPQVSADDDHRPLILIIDDNSDFRMFLKDCLLPHYRMAEAQDGTQAWEMLPELQPDIIVSDVMMPGIDGIELCKRVKSDIRTSHIPLILLTARSAEEQKIEGFESGADEYITKPFNHDILLIRIRKLLQLRENRQQEFKGKITVAPSEITITSLDEKLVQKAIDYVEKNMDRSELSVEELSRELGMSRVHLYKKLLSITGKTPIEFIRTIRLKRAAQLLAKSQLSVSEIAYQVGFNNPKYFSKYFKEEFGVLPSVYQEKGGD